jgi:hypothetical protein
MLLGFTMAWLSVHATTAQGTHSVPPVVCLWIMAVPLADAASCIVRRVMTGVTPMTPDLRHLHHLVRRSGMSVGKSVGVIVAGSFVCGLVGVGGWWLGITEQWLFAGVAKGRRQGCNHARPSLKPRAVGSHGQGKLHAAIFLAILLPNLPRGI